MIELVVIVEGETEQTFVRDQLAAHLALRNSTTWPVLPGRHRHHGGVKKGRSPDRISSAQKRAQGPIITGRIGIETLRLQCPHFGEWITRLERIGALVA